MAKKVKKTQNSEQWKEAFLFVLRISLGWLFLYSGLMKLYTPEWSAIGLLTNANTFPDLYNWFASDANIGWVNFMNVWGQILIGLGLVSGTLTRLASIFGALMMALYYFPSLEFPYVAHGFIVDEHIIYALALAVLANQRAGQFVGIDKYLSEKVKAWWL